MNTMRIMVLEQQEFTCNTQIMKYILSVFLLFSFLNPSLYSQEKPCVDTLSITKLNDLATDDLVFQFSSTEGKQQSISTANMYQLLQADDLSLKTISKEQYLFANALVSQLRFGNDSVQGYAMSKDEELHCIDFTYPNLKKRVIPFAKIERMQLESRQQDIIDSIRIVNAALDRQNKMIVNAKNDHESNLALFEENKKAFYEKYSEFKSKIDELFKKSSQIDDMLAAFKAGKSLSTSDKEKIVETTNAILYIKNQVNSAANGFTPDYDQLNNSSVRLSSFQANVDTLNAMILESKQTLKRLDLEQKKNELRLITLKKILS